MLSRSDVFMLLSHREGLPNAMLEAMAYECAVIANPVGAVTCVVEHELNGLIVKPGDLSSVEIALTRLYECRELRENLGRAARMHIIQHHDVNVIYKEFDELIRLA